MIYIVYKYAYHGRKDKVVNMEMCNAMKEFLEGGRREGQREGRIEGQRDGRIEGKDEARLDSIRTLMKKLDQTAEEAMDTLDIADEDKVRYRRDARLISLFQCAMKGASYL